ncbi:hypothetical protein Q669_00540 [Labrenzia sp. C1B10]|uniref:antitoxin Xre-like helix-turn-helix domain-containing protein n=1 Tax=unclassified Labrenzia TaxID=2648686 RepID=UPI0003B8E103|nr:MULTISPECIES: antitoxin Xre-like helix-turn-helix domain-containing protein [unclassified Labrenzia]ERP98778.1 hypothetical protein Q669_00540 [Labrenzia sp. C1B10]ERS00952.1 hypothetical protein Q675_09100 [Labrenzia sp. C1B70]
MNHNIMMPLDAKITPIDAGDAGRIQVVLKAVVEAFGYWGLTNEESAALFDVSVATWNRIKSGEYKGQLDRDKVTRASLIIGLFKGLRLLFNGPLTYGWPKTENQGYGFLGKSPVQVMIEGGIPAMMRVRQHIDALRGGL